MDVRDLPIKCLREAPWNPNVLDEAGIQRLRASLGRFGLVQNLVVRPLGEAFEVIGGNQRLQLLRETGLEQVPCVVVDLDDARARLLAQALNRVHGEDDIGLRAELVREVLRELPINDVIEVLPESAKALTELASLGASDVADYLRNWQRAQSSRLRHLVFHLTPAQADVVDKALESVPARAGTTGENPNRRGNALYLLCQEYLRDRGVSPQSDVDERRER